MFVAARVLPFALISAIIQVATLKVQCWLRLDGREHRGVPAYSLLYMFFWPWNAPYEPLRGHPIGAHVADLEHVRLIVDRSSLQIIEVRPYALQP